MARTAEDPWSDGRPPHVPARSGQLPSVCLLPGDPARVAMAASLLDDFTELGFNREFRLATGSRNGVEVAICSTGIGGPSAEIAVVELERLGVDTFIRVGGMGALAADIKPGELTQVEFVLSDSGAARFYRHDTSAIAIHPQVGDALLQAARSHHQSLRRVKVLSCDSYYIGEGRPLQGLGDAAKARLDFAAQMGADAMDMECETIYAVASALRCKYGAILATRGNRVTNEWLDDYEPTQHLMLDIAIDAAVGISRAARESS